ncbi:MAG: ferrochelatase [Bacteroidales bacterium]|nr:ferrochelatase [Bacteroidales bacterium]
MKPVRKALILVNVGTPDSPDTESVRRYLTEFLNDKKVIDLPWLARKILVNLIIIPFRVRKSTTLYRRLWTDKGSPLLMHMQSLVLKLRSMVPAGTDVFGAMSYGKPSLRSLLTDLASADYDEITVLPLYPQYADSTTGSVSELVSKHRLKINKDIEMVIIQQFWSHPAFIGCFTEAISSCSPDKFDHIIFSYHGLPLRQISKIHPGRDSRNCICEKEMPEWGHSCYKAACYGTTRMIAEKLKPGNDRYSTAFQSRLSRNWLSPFTDETLIKLAGEGAERVLLVAPSFVTDCLETLVEIGDEYSDLFIKHGGKELVLVESLNDSTRWAEAILDICDI